MAGWNSMRNFIFPKYDSVCIVGRGTGWDLAPPIDKALIWGVNALLLQRPVHVTFDMHDLDNLHYRSIFQGAEIELIKRLNMPLISIKKYPDIPSSFEYPLFDVIRYTGVDYFTNTIDYMIAFAIYCGFKEINLYGVNMATNSEYAYEKPGVDFWIGYALGKGIKVNYESKWSTMLRSRDDKVYGYRVPLGKLKDIIKER